MGVTNHLLSGMILQAGMEGWSNYSATSHGTKNPKWWFSKGNGTPYFQKNPGWLDGRVLASDMFFFSTDGLQNGGQYI